MEKTDHMEFYASQTEFIRKSASDPDRPFTPVTVDPRRVYDAQEVADMMRGLYREGAAAIARSARRLLPKPRAVDLRPTEPWQRRLKIDEGFTQNYVQVLYVERVPSPYYAESRRPRMMGTGKLFCLCLACGKGGNRRDGEYDEREEGWQVPKYKLSLNPEKSLYSCGCKKRPRKNAVRTPKPERIDKRTSTPVVDLWEERFGRLVVVGFNRDHGWRCQCDCGGQCFRSSSELKSRERAKRMQCCGRECPLTVRGFTRAKPIIQPRP